MRVDQSLPDAVINEAGGLAAAKVIGMLSKAAAPVRGAIFGERSVLMSNLQTEMRAGLRADLPIDPSLEGITPGGSAAVFGSTGRTGTADYLSRFSSTELDALRFAGLSDVEIACHVQLSGDVYLFRGTSPGRAGSPFAQATAVSATTGPYIATVFFLEARGQAGQAVIQFGPRSSIGTFDVGNWMAAQEREVEVLITSRDFAAQAPSPVPVDTARQVLGEMDMPALPHTVASPSARSMLLDAAPRMTPDQVFEFLQLINKMGQR